MIDFVYHDHEHYMGSEAGPCQNRLDTPSNIRGKVVFVNLDNRMLKLFIYKSIFILINNINVIVY